MKIQAFPRFGNLTIKQEPNNQVKVYMTAGSKHDSGELLIQSGENKPVSQSLSPELSEALKGLENQMQEKFRAFKLNILGLPSGDQFDLGYFNQVWNQHHQEMKNEVQSSLAKLVDPISTALGFNEQQAQAFRTTLNSDLAEVNMGSDAYVLLRRGTYDAHFYSPIVSFGVPSKK